MPKHTPRPEPNGTHPLTPPAPAAQQPDAKQATPSYASRARIVCPDGFAARTLLTIGGIPIPFNEVTIRIKTGHRAVIEALVPAEHVDVQALQEDTRVTIIDERAKCDE